jgi:hypothetical protein
MTNDALTKDCTSFYDQEIWGTSRAYAIKALERMSKRMQAVGLREAAAIANDEHVNANDTGEETDIAYNSACNDIVKALYQKAEECESLDE